jgi:hypothetical protein
MADTMYAGLASRRLRGVFGALAAIAAGAALADAAPSTGGQVPGAAGAAAPPPVPATTALPAPAVAAAKPVPLPSGQVWECMVNGQRTFSDVRCGAQSTVRQLSPLNIMDVPSTRPSAPYGLYQTGYAPRPTEPPAPEDNAADFANDAYWGPAVVAVNLRPMRGHRAAPHGNHGHSRARKN